METLFTVFECLKFFLFCLVSSFFIKHFAIGLKDVLAIPKGPFILDFGQLIILSLFSAAILYCITQAVLIIV
jgi:hypothetical protein